jgi:pilus assembly protein CpaF
MTGQSAGAIERIEAECRELVRTRGVDPAVDAPAVTAIAQQVIAAYRDRAISVALPPLGDAESALRSVVDNIAGYGPLQALLDDRTVEEIWINEPGRVFIARHGRSELTTIVLGPDEVAELVERMLRPSGRRLDLSSPLGDVSKEQSVDSSTALGARGAQPGRLYGCWTSLGCLPRTSCTGHRLPCFRLRLSSARASSCTWS